jgi:N-acyl-D-amino-acid deacylase
MLDLVIRNAQLVDGTGAPAYAGDLAVAAGRIAALGRISERGATEIDARGQVLAPGFIDLHTHYDCQLFWDPNATPSPWHGVTTVVMGNCGFTMAPCHPEHRETVMRLMAYVEGIPLDTLRAALPWSWTDYPSYLDALEAQGTGVNVASFIGHSAMRLWVMGADAVERAATPSERAEMAGLVREGMRAGALGWSTSFSQTHFFGDDGKPCPSRLADADEVRALAAVLREFDRGLIEIAPRTIIGGVDDKSAEQQFFAELARESGKTVVWAPLLANAFQPGGAARLIDEAAAFQAAGQQVVPQVGCRPLELRFDFTTAGFGLDNNAIWKPIMAKPLAERRRLFADPEFRRELRSYGEPFVAALTPGWHRLFVRFAATPAVQALQDQSIAEIAAARGEDPLEVFCDVVLADDLRTQWGALMMNEDAAVVGPLLRHPAGLLALSDAGAHCDTLCDQGFTSYLLGHWVRDTGVLGLEEAVRLITSVPAARYGLEGRGQLRVGDAADLVLFDRSQVGMLPTELAHDLPGGQRRLLQRARGVDYVFVNGVAVVEQGVPVDRRPGRLLRGGH